MSFKRRQVQQKPLSRFISHLYSPPKRLPRPTIQIPSPSPDEYEIPDNADNELEDFATEQGYAKEELGDWVSEGGVGARKYDDLTAIGRYLLLEHTADREIGFMSMVESVYVFEICHRDLVY